MKGKLFQKACAVSLSALMLTGAGAAELISFAGASLTVSAAVSASDFSYYVNDEAPDEVTLTDYHGTDTDVTIPRTINGMTVTRLSYTFSGTSVKRVVIPDTVHTIHYSTFKDCIDLQSVTIPDSVKTISDEAFLNCTSLSSITIPKNVTKIGEDAFAGMDNLQTINVSADNPLFSSVGGVLFNKSKTTLIRFPGGKEGTYTLPGTVTKIEKNAFANCMGLTAVTMGSRVQEIGEAAFTHCESLTSINLSTALQALSDEMFLYCESLDHITIPDSVKSIGENTFTDCPSLTSLTIPSGVTSIASTAFLRCYSLESFTVNGSNPSFSSANGILYDKNKETLICCPSNCAESVTVPSGVRTIGDYAFYKSIGLSMITLPSGLSRIGMSSFAGDSITRVTLPASVTRIDDGAFKDCYQLQYVNMPEAVSYMGEEVFENTPYIDNRSDGAVYTGKVFYCYKGTMPANTSLTINDGTTCIAGDALDRCSGLVSVTLPDSLLGIGSYAFSDCYKLTSITVPAAVKTLGKGAFYNCSGLTGITLKSGLQEIGAFAFANCSNLKVLTVPESVSEIGENAFYYCSSLTTLRLPQQVTSLPKQLCYGCMKLSSFTCSDNLEMVGEDAFGSNPWRLNLPAGANYRGKVLIAYVYDEEHPVDYYKIKDGTTYIYDGAFSSYGKSTLRCVEMPDSVKGMGIIVFSQCDKLQQVRLSKNLTSLPQGTFGYCGSLRHVDIPEGVTEIGADCFYNCSNIQDVVLPQSLEVIDEDAFYRCISFRHIQFPQKLRLIGERAFYFCNLSTIVLPANVQVEEDAFIYHRRTVDVYVPASVETLGDASFSSPKNTTICGPTGSYAEIYARRVGLPFKEVPFINTSVVSRPWVTAGETVQFNCSAEGGEGTFQYGVWYQKDDGDWTKVRSYADRPTVSFTPDSAGKYVFRVKVRNEQKQVVALDIPYTVYPPLENLSSLADKTILYHDPVTISLSSAGQDGAALYDVRYQNSQSSQWIVSQLYSTKTTVTKTPYYTGDYTFRVTVMDALGRKTVKDYPAYVYLPLENTSAVSAQTLSQGKTLTVNANAVNGYGTKTFLVSYKLDGTGDWKRVQDYSPNKKVNITFENVGTYTVLVKAKDKDGNYAKKTFTVKVTAPLKNTSTVSTSSTDSDKTAVIVRASSTGGQGAKQYAVWYKRSTLNTWTLVQDYSTNTTVSFTPKYAATYDISVKVKDQSGDIVKKAFTVTVSQ